jgi:hypothetical protein
MCEADWREVAGRAVRAEAARRGLGAAYDLEADGAGIAGALIEALTRWRGEASPGTATPAAPPGFVLPDTADEHLLCARWMLCPACGQAAGRYILALPDGRVLALEGDLTYACPGGEALAEISALCGACGETAQVADFQGVLPAA